MIRVVTVCGNDLGIEVEAESCDSNAAVGKNADLYVTVKEFKDIFPETANVCIVESYTNRKKIEPVLAPVLQEMNNN